MDDTDLILKKQDDGTFRIDHGIFGKEAQINGKLSETKGRFYAIYAANPNHPTHPGDLIDLGFTDDYFQVDDLDYNYNSLSSKEKQDVLENAERILRLSCNRYKNENP